MLTKTNTIKIITSTIIIGVMILFSQIFDNKEIIFPEILALCVGAIVAQKRPWNISLRYMILLMTLCSIIGFVLSAYVPIPIELKIMIGFVVCTVILMISKTSLFPCISACILPIIVGCDSVIYPISVIVATFFVIAFSYFYRKIGFSDSFVSEKSVYNYKLEAAHYLMLFVVLAIITPILNHFNIILCIAPPLIVAFVELSYPKSRASKAPIFIGVLITMCASIGVAFRIIFSDILPIPMFVTAMIVSLIVSVLLLKSGQLFPPAAALSILPFLIDESQLKWFPFMILAGCAILIPCSMFIRKIVKHYEDIEKKKEDVLVP